jgi:hypothetical protein
MTEVTTSAIEIDESAYGYAFVEQAEDHAVAEKTQRVYDTGEQVTCTVRVWLENGRWKGSFVLYSDEAGDSTYHAQAQLDELRSQRFLSGQAAMDEAIDAVEAGFMALAEVRAEDD